MGAVQSRGLASADDRRQFYNHHQSNRRLRTASGRQVRASVESNDNQYGWLFGGRSLLWEAPISGSISDIFDCKSQQQHQQHRQHLGSEAKRRMVRVDWSGQGLKGCLPAKIVFGNATIYQLDLSRNEFNLIPSNIWRISMGMKRLDLSSNLITCISDEIGHLTSLQYLDLSHNSIRSFSPCVGRLINLTCLGLSDCRLTHLPKVLGELTGLNKLGLFSNLLTELDGSVLGRLVNLRKLDISHNSLTTLPTEIGKLTQLELLNASCNDMTHLPEEISLLTQLCQLGLGRNQLSKLPDISRLQQLRILTAYDNALTTLDESLGRLIAVEKLDFSANSITDVHWSVFQLPALTYLNLRRNKLCQIQSPPLDSLLESRKNRSEMVIVDLSWNELQSIPYRFTLMANWQLRLNKNPFNRPISEFKIFSVPVSLKLLALRSIYRRHFKKNRIAIDKGKLETWVKLYRLPFRLHEELLRYDYCEICWAPVQTDYLISKVVPYSCGAESGRCNTLQCIICNNRKALLAKFGL